MSLKHLNNTPKIDSVFFTRSFAFSSMFTELVVYNSFMLKAKHNVIKFNKSFMTTTLDNPVIR